MKSTSKLPKSFVWSTLTIFALAIIVTSLFAKAEIPPGIEIDTTNQPTQGYANAPIQIVVFEEPKCSSCSDFSKDIYPKLKKEFIDTKKVRYTLILVSFLPNSMPAAEAMLCVYYSDPEYPNSDHFFEYSDYIYQHQPNEDTDWCKTPLLLDFAKKTNPAINLEKLKDCITRDTYRIQIEKNTAYAKEVMGGGISTPTLYLDGVQIKEFNYEMLSSRIKELLKQKGVH